MVVDLSFSFIQDDSSWDAYPFLFDSNKNFGGEPYGGRQVIFFKGKPLWITVYYGQVDNVVKNIKDVYTFLKKALLHPRKNFPLRGQPEFKDGNYKYTSILRGDVRNFYLEEKIYKKNAEIYSAGFFGGFVDQRSEE